MTTLTQDLGFDEEPGRASSAREHPISGAALSLAIHAALLAVCALFVASSPPEETPPIALDVTVMFEAPGPPAPSPTAMAEALASLSRLAAPPAPAEPAPTLPSAVAPPEPEPPIALPVAAEPPPPTIAPTLPTATLPILPPVPAAPVLPVAMPAAPKPPTPKPAPRPPTPVPASAPAPSAPSAPMAATAPATAPAPPSPASATEPAGGPPIAATAVAAQGASGKPSDEAAPSGPLVVTNPDYRSPPEKPVYPRKAIDLGLEGEVLVRAQIDEAGDPVELTVWRSSGHPLLDRAAVDAVRRWRFKPAQRNGKPVPAIVQAPVSFRLR